MKVKSLVVVIPATRQSFWIESENLFAAIFELHKGSSPAQK